ncbi:MAG TPA: serine hydrolase domain-containing protein [Steroidobacteraceae bacterium]|nr:serine hydrolase domain-containing protein [Steroidobacteraceae bacterium]
MTVGLLLLWAVGPGTTFARVDLSTDAVRSWADDVFARMVQQGRGSGVGVIAVQNGKVTFVGRYGYADAALKKAIDPAITRFRIGSTSKTFTALAIAILLDEGRIGSLDDPANKYLKRAHLPRIAGRDITVWDLLTHRGGFEAKEWYYDPTTLPMPAADVQKNIPALNESTADESEYCNACVALLGVLVEDITGDLLQNFLDERVFRPLKMDTTVLNASRSPSVEVGVAYQPGKTAPVPVRYPPVPEFLAPAGSVEATLDDMGRYMVAMLGGAGSQIISAKTRQLMFTPHVRNHPRSSSFGMIWMLHEWNGVRVAEHGGRIDPYHTMLSLFPDDDAGIFVSCYCSLGEAAQPPRSGSLFEVTGYNFREMIYRHFLGVPPPEPVIPTALADYVGVYEDDARTRDFMRNVFRILAPVAAENGYVKVTASGDALYVDGLGPYRMVSKDVFRDPDINGGDGFVPYPNMEYRLFSRDRNGHVVTITSLLSAHTASRIHGWQLPARQRFLLIAGAIVAASGFLVIFWPPASTRLARLARYGIAAAAAGAVLAPLACLAIWHFDWAHPRMIFSAQEASAANTLRAITSLQMATAIAAVAALLMLFVPTLGAGRGNRWIQIHAVAVVLGAFAVSIVLMTPV